MSSYSRQGLNSIEILYFQSTFFGNTKAFNGSLQINNSFSSKMLTLKIKFLNNMVFSEDSSDFWVQISCVDPSFPRFYSTNMSFTYLDKRKKVVTLVEFADD